MPLKAVIAPVYNMEDVRRRFLELTGWEDTHQGPWNCKFEKELTVDIDYGDRLLEDKDENYAYFDEWYPEDGTMTLDQWKARKDHKVAPDPATYRTNPTYTGYRYKGHVIYTLHFSILLAHLRSLEEVQKEGLILVEGSQ